MRSTSLRNSLYVLALGLLVLGAGAFYVARPQTHQSKSKPVPASTTDEGQRTFASKCASCHGLDARGGERGPNLAGNAMLQRLPDADIAEIIINGIPETEMPSFGALGPAGARAVVSYLRVLQGGSKGPALSGDPARGKTIFFGKGDCSSCHMVRGEGGFVGPDLSTYGLVHGSPEILAAITTPGKNGEAGYKPAAAVTKDGHRISGVIRNEDNFSIQMQTPDGAFHFFSRSDLQALEYQDHPMMPADYAARLSHEEMNDVASYLMNPGNDAKSTSATPPDKLDHEDE